MSRTAGGWGDPFGKNVSALLSVPPPNPTASQGDVGGTGCGAPTTPAGGADKGPGGGGVVDRWGIIGKYSVGDERRMRGGGVGKSVLGLL